MSLTLAEALRYFLSGVVVLVYWWAFEWASDRHALEAILEGRDSAVVASVALAGGAIAYLVYRVCFYETIIIWLQDLVCCLTGTHNYRTYLRTQYSQLCDRQAERLYAAIFRAEHIKLPGSTLVGNLHFGYMSGLAAIPFAVASGCSARYRLSVGFAALAILLLFVTFVLDRRTERQELDSLLRVNQRWKTDRIVFTLFPVEPTARPRRCWVVRVAQCLLLLVGVGVVAYFVCQVARGAVLSYLPR